MLHNANKIKIFLLLERSRELSLNLNLSFFTFLHKDVGNNKEHAIKKNEKIKIKCVATMH